MNIQDELIHLLKKELFLLRRNQELIWFALLFGGATATLFLFAHANTQPSSEQTVGFLWLSLLMTITLTIDKVYEKERSEGTLELICIIPIRKTSFYLTKLIISLVYACIPMSVILLIAFFAWNIPVLYALPSFLMGALGLSSLSALFGAFPLQKNDTKMLLPLFVFPLAIPIILIGSWATFDGLETNSISSVWHHLLWMIDFTYIGIGIFLFRLLCAKG